MRRAVAVVGVAALALVLAAWLGFIEWAHQRTGHSRWAIARAPFGAVTGCGADDDVKRICAFAELALARTLRGEPLTEDTWQSTEEMCNPGMMTVFSAVASVSPKDKYRMLQQGAAEVGATLRCDALERLWALPIPEDAMGGAGTTE